MEQSGLKKTPTSSGEALEIENLSREQVEEEYKTNPNLFMQRMSRRLDYIADFHKREAGQNAGKQKEPTSEIEVAAGLSDKSAVVNDTVESTTASITPNAVAEVFDREGSTVLDLVAAAYNETKEKLKEGLTSPECKAYFPTKEQQSSMVTGMQDYMSTFERLGLDREYRLRGYRGNLQHEMSQLEDDTIFKDGLRTQMDLCISIAALHRYLGINLFPLDQSAQLSNSVNSLLLFHSGRRREIRAKPNCESSCLLEELYIREVVDDAVSDIRYEAVFPHYMFVPNLRVTEHDDGSRSNLQGVLLLVATALSGLETSGEVRDGPELNRLLTSARDTEAYHSALHKLSVLLFGMSPAKAMVESNFVGSCAKNVKHFINVVLKKGKNQVVPLHVGRALQYLCIQWLYGQMIIALSTNWHLLTVGVNKSDPKDGAKGFLDFLKEGIVSLYMGEKQCLFFWEAKGQAMFQEMHMYDFFVKYIILMSTNNDKKEGSDQKTKTEVNISHLADTHHFKRTEAFHSGAIQTIIQHILLLSPSMESMPADLQRYYNVLLSENEFYSCGTERAVADVSVQANSNVGVGQRTASESNAGVEENIVSPLQPEGGNEVVTESKKKKQPNIRRKQQNTGAIDHPNKRRKGDVKTTNVV